MKLNVYSADGSSHSEKEFADFPVFEGDRGLLAVRQVVLAIQANLRQGTHSTKTVGTVAGTNKKPFRQKGRGAARQGSLRTVQHRGGGIAFGPHPRDYNQKVNRKVKTLALQRVLFDTASEGKLALIEKWSVDAPKTKLFNSLITKIAPEGSTLVVDDKFEDATALAARNIPNVHLGQADSINAYDIIRYKNVVVSESAFQTLLSRLNGGAE
jgi:large subunit ribosomal protein L4